MSGTHVPQLRFNAFRDSWKLEFFGKLYDFYSTNSYSRSVLSNDRGRVFNIHYGDIHTRYSTCFDVSSEEVPRIDPDLAKDRFSKDQYCREGDLVIADASEDYSDIGKAIELVALHGKEVVAGLHTLLARPKNGAMALGFAAYWMQSSRVRHQVKVKAQGTKVLGISAGKLAEVESYLPTLPEQQKIAAFLGGVDRKIQQLKRKQELLEQYKKGVVQQLFSQELRFKREDGSEYPEWEERELNSFLIPTLREVPVPSKPYLSIGIRSHGKGTFQKPNTEPSSTVMETLFQVRPQDFIVNITFAWEGAVAIVPKEDDGGLVSHRFPTYTFERSIAIPDFFRYVVVQPRFKHMLEMISPGGAGRNRVMSKTKLLEQSVMLPSVEEQSRIAGFLMALDAKVAGVAQAVAAAEKWKKGLLQQMFV